MFHLCSLGYFSEKTFGISSFKALPHIKSERIVKSIRIGLSKSLKHLKEKLREVFAKSTKTTTFVRKISMQSFKI